MDAAAFQKAVSEFRVRYESAMTPSRVADQLLLGKNGTVEVAWRSNEGTDYSATIKKATSKLPGVELRGDVLALRFFTGAPEELKSLSLPESLTIDLRQSTMGDFSVMRECLALLAPSGDYGEIEREQAGRSRRLSVEGGAEARRALRLVVDRSTWGAAAVFAQALVSSGQATLTEGELKGALPWIEVVGLPDGSGYTLRTGTYSPLEARS
jgi:hypothetical protein